MWSLTALLSFSWNSRERARRWSDSSLLGIGGLMFFTVLSMLRLIPLGRVFQLPWWCFSCTSLNIDLHRPAKSGLADISAPVCGPLRIELGGKLLVGKLRLRLIVSVGFTLTLLLTPVGNKLATEKLLTCLPGPGLSNGCEAAAPEGRMSGRASLVRGNCLPSRDAMLACIALIMFFFFFSSLLGCTGPVRGIGW